jgi:hypothetical protein
MKRNIKGEKNIQNMAGKKPSLDEDKAKDDIYHFLKTGLGRPIVALVQSVSSQRMTR